MGTRDLVTLERCKMKGWCSRDRVRALLSIRLIRTRRTSIGCSSSRSRVCDRIRLTQLILCWVERLTFRRRDWILCCRSPRSQFKNCWSLWKALLIQIRVLSIRKSAIIQSILKYLKIYNNYLEASKEVSKQRVRPNWEELCLEVFKTWALCKTKAQIARTAAILWFWTNRIRRTTWRTNTMDKLITRISIR